jgi:hypothetical protein
MHIMAHHSNNTTLVVNCRESAFHEYIRNMHMPGTWGDELTLRAAADVLKVKVYVITSEEQNWLLHYDIGDGKKGGGERCLFITYTSPIHYNTAGHLPRTDPDYRVPTYDNKKDDGHDGGSGTESTAGRQVWL